MSIHQGLMKAVPDDAQRAGLARHLHAGPAVPVTRLARLLRQTVAEMNYAT